jgi:DNA polymerase-3 subunit gamma/tau
MLRTFDDLGYRQEQRFHLELGLLKLVHVQRLVPVEELLSQLGSRPMSSPSTTPTAPRAASVAAPASSVSSAPRASASSAAVPTHTMSATAGALALAPEMAQAVAPAPAQQGPQLVPAPAPTVAPDLSTLQHALAAALAAVKGHQSASEQIEEATVTLEGDTLTIQTSLSKAMLPAVFNADADRILKAALRSAYPTALKLNLLPGTTPAATAAPKRPRPAASGSAAELAERHPLVQQARELFSAEISNVIDLRDKE